MGFYWRLTPVLGEAYTHVLGLEGLDVRQVNNPSFKHPFFKAFIIIHRTNSDKQCILFFNDCKCARMPFVPHGDSRSLMPLSMLSCRQVMSAPNLLRVGTPENVFVECQDCTSGNIRVEIKVMNHPTKAEILTSTAVTLNSGNNFQGLGEITVKVN